MLCLHTWTSSKFKVENRIKIVMLEMGRVAYSSQLTFYVLARDVCVDKACLVVVNYDVVVERYCRDDGQPDFETYRFLHRIGRTGRFGRKGRAIILVWFGFGPEVCYIQVLPRWEGEKNWPK